MRIGRELLAASRRPGPTSPGGSRWQPQGGAENRTLPWVALPEGPGEGSALCPFL